MPPPEMTDGTSPARPPAPTPDEAVRVPYVREDAALPALRQGYPDDAGADLIALRDGAIAPGQTTRIPTNVALAIPPGYYGMVAGRSSVASAGLLTHIGTVDAGYRGRIEVVVTNLADTPFPYTAGQRIAQLILIPYARAAYAEVDALPPSSRGERGFGSSGR